MKAEVKELIRAEQRRSDFSFITEVVQRGRIRPAKYVHSLKMPVSVYQELLDHNIIDYEDYLLFQIAFFEFKGDFTIISFVNLYECEDLHRKVDYYLVKKAYGVYPIERIGVSRMNFDKSIEPVQLEKYKKPII